MENSNVNIMDLFLVLFVGLKITSQIDWSWWWIMSPLWIQLVVAMLVILVAYGGAKK